MSFDMSALASPKTDKIQKLRALPTEGHENLVFSNFVEQGSNALESVRQQAALISQIVEGERPFSSLRMKDDFFDSLVNNFDPDYPDINYDKIAEVTLSDDVWLTLITSSPQTAHSRFSQVEVIFDEGEYLRKNGDTAEINARKFYFGSNNKQEFKDHYRDFVQKKEYVRGMIYDYRGSKTFCERNCTIL